MSTSMDCRRLKDSKRGSNMNDERTRSGEFEQYMDGACPMWREWADSLFIDRMRGCWTAAQFIASQYRRMEAPYAGAGSGTPANGVVPDTVASAPSSTGEKPGTPSMYILNSCDTDEQRIAKLAEALDDLSVAYAAATRSVASATRRNEICVQCGVNEGEVCRYVQKGGYCPRTTDSTTK